jgi:transcriptional regulator with XRE-family HTH domain
MADVINGNWILERLDKRHGAKADLADAIGLDRDKLTKVLRGNRRLTAEEIARVQDYFTRKPSRKSLELREPGATYIGFAEGDVAPLPSSAKPREEQLMAICRSLAPERQHVSLSRASRDLTSFAILRGDFLVLDMKPEPKQGDLVIGQMYDADHGSAVSLVRQYLPPFYVTRDPAAEYGTIAEIDPNLRIAAVIIASFRSADLTA